MNVLIIEDDSFLASHIEKAFSSYMFLNRIVHVKSYWDFLEMSDTILSFDTVLLDINLWEVKGNKNGFDVLSHIRKKSTTIPVIVISSHSEYSFLEKAFAKWAHDYMIKPFRTRELQIRIERWFRNYILSEYFCTNKILRYEELVYDISAYEFYYERNKIELTRSNKYILSLLFIYREKLLHQFILVEKIWWHAEENYEKNLRIKIMRLKEQLKTVWIDHWIQTVRWEGYMFKKT